MKQSKQLHFIYHPKGKFKNNKTNKRMDIVIKRSSAYAPERIKRFCKKVDSAPYISGVRREPELVYCARTAPYCKHLIRLYDC